MLQDQSGERTAYAVTAEPMARRTAVPQARRAGEGVPVKPGPR
jgi:hypothetical protein